MKLLVSLLFFSSSMVLAQDLSTIYENNKAVKIMKEENYTSAQEHLLKALGSDPLHPGLHLNLGLSYSLQGQSEKAVQSYQTALKYGADPQSQFIGNFNLGEINGRDKKIDEALTYYQAALEMKPDSIEAKTNIELLISQQQKSGGEGKDQKDPKDDKEKKDQKDQQNQKDQKDSKDNKDQQDKKEAQKYAKNRPQPQKFKSEELRQDDVNKILGEIRQQEQKIRAEYNKKVIKEQPNGKDW